MRIRIPANGWRPRVYQQPLWNYLENGGRHAVAVWHRRAGKDEVALHRTCSSAHERIGNYWHMLPEAKQGRKVVWEAINPHTGRRRVDEVFPPEIVAGKRDDEMIVRLKCGSTWQVVGSDNFNSLLGSPPVGIVYSEWSVANPRADAFLRPILAENGGWQLKIFTPRGYNHGHASYQSALGDESSFAQILTAEDTNVISPEVLASERKAYQEEYGQYEGDALFRQEYYCDFSAANIGAILGRYIEVADKQGRICDFPVEPGEIIVSSDIGFRDTASWWFWQMKIGGFDLIDYDEDSGLDAGDWITRLKDKSYKYGKIWLPHDAKVKTFQSKHSSLEQFIKAFGAGKVDIVPQASKLDRINAARTIAPKCRFHKTKCKEGLNGLRSWSFEYNEETKTYSKEPKHDWASHPGDGYSYGAQVMREMTVEVKKDEPMKDLSEVTLNDVWSTQKRGSSRI